MNALIVFLICISIAILMIFKGLNIALSIAITATLYTLMIFKENTVAIFINSLNFTMLQTVVSLILAMLLAELYRSTSASRELVESLISINPVAASIAIPMIIGLLPMPAGAYISATLVDNVYNEFSLNPAEKTYINYWYRHIWVSIWPLYQVVILSSAILEIPISTIILINIPIAIAMLISGSIVTYSILRKRNALLRNRHKNVKGLLHLWPFISIAILSIVFNVYLPMAIAITIVLLLVVYKPSRRAIVNSLRYSMNLTIIFLIVFSFVFSRAIEMSNLASYISSLLKGYEKAVVFLTPFMIVLATGFEFTFAVLAFPPLRSFLSNSANIIYAFTGGVMGAMMSPSHACLALSSQYYRAKMRDVYRYLIPSISITIAIVFAYTYLLRLSL